MPLIDPMNGLPHDVAVLDTCVTAVLNAWRVAPIPDVDSSEVRDRGRECLLDAAVGVGDVHARLPLPDQLRAILDTAYRPRWAVPATVDLAIWGYWATKMIKPVGLSSIRHT